MKPKAILFDLDDTILQCESGDYLKLWMKSVEEHVHLFPDLIAHDFFIEIRKVADAFWADPDRHKKGRLDMLKARIHMVSTAAKNLKCENDKAAVQLASHFHDVRENNVTPFDGAIETLQYYKDSSIKTALITNGAEETQRSKINKFNLQQYFDIILIEGEFGQGKPHPEVYKHILNELNENAQDAWIVGDNLEWEVRAPQELGFYAIWNDFRGEGLPKDSKVVPDRIINKISELKP